jgi:uncharacterized protein
MIFVDTNVIMYAVGGEHPLRERARAFFEESLVDGRPLVTFDRGLEAAFRG